MYNFFRWQTNLRSYSKGLSRRYNIDPRFLSLPAIVCPPVCHCLSVCLSVCTSVHPFVSRIAQILQTQVTDRQLSPPTSLTPAQITKSSSSLRKRRPTGCRPCGYRAGSFTRPRWTATRYRPKGEEMTMRRGRADGVGNSWVGGCLLYN